MIQHKITKCPICCKFNNYQAVEIKPYLYFSTLCDVRAKGLYHTVFRKNEIQLTTESAFPIMHIHDNEIQIDIGRHYDVIIMDPIKELNDDTIQELYNLLYGIKLFQ